MSYTNVYPSRINWENEPSIVSPINATNLNKMDYALYEMDGTLDNWDTTKANQSDLLLCVKSIDYDDETGEFVFTWQNGTTKTVDLNIEKIPVSFSMDANGVITMTTDDGTTYTADVGSLIKTYTFTDSTEIDFTVTTDASGNKTVTAALVAGSITGDKLEPNYLANCQSAANSASGSATAADGSAEDSEAWAVGERNGVPVPSSDPTYHNNSKYWSQQAPTTTLSALTDTDINNPSDGEVLKYDGANSKWINGQEAAGGGSTVTVTTSASALYGQTATLTDNNTSYTAVFDNSGKAVFTGVTLTGTVYISASVGGQTATTSLSIPYFGNYSTSLSFFTATITVTFPASLGATCTLDGQTATTSPHTFTVSATGTYVASCVLDGQTKTASVTISADGESKSATIEYGTINITYDNDFRGSTITCTQGGTTISKTAPSGGNTMAFYPPTTGNWTVSGSAGGQAYNSNPNPVVVSSLSTAVSATLQTLATISVTMYGAAGATITWTNADNTPGTATLDSSGAKTNVPIIIQPTGQTITFTDTNKAKNPNNLSANYAKNVSLSASTTEVRVMPDNALYWYGYAPAWTHGVPEGIYSTSHTYSSTIEINTNNITLNHGSTTSTYDCYFTTNPTSLSGKSALKMIFKNALLTYDVTSLSDSRYVSFYLIRSSVNTNITYIQLGTITGFSYNSAYIYQNEDGENNQVCNAVWYE